MLNTCKLMNWRIPMVSPSFYYSFMDASMPDGTSLTRATTTNGASRFNSSGAMVFESADVARFDYKYNGLSWELAGLLVEPQSTNLLEYSNDITNVAWSKAGSATTSANNPSAPDGTSTLNKLTRTTTAASGVSNNTVKPAASQPFVMSAFVQKGSVGNYQTYRVREGTANYIDCVYNLATGTKNDPTFAGSGYTTGSSYITDKEGFYRTELRGDNSITSTAFASWYSVNSAGVPTLTADSVDNSNGYVWGLQFEFNKLRATSFIKTTTSAVTRPADILSITIPNGIVTIRYTFDDNSTQDVAVSSLTALGGNVYQIDAATLSRPWLRSIESV
jgi:hypothetical protein